jgi:DNA-binding NarL/FixJ family response regulator
LKELLAARFSGAIYGEAKDGRQAMKLARAQNWDVLLLDISMPGSSGLTVLKSLRRMGSKIPVLVLSMHAEGEYGRSAREAGASGYVNKSSATTELIAAINVVLAGGTYFAGQGRNDGPAHSASGDSKRQHACNSVG